MDGSGSIHPVRQFPKVRKFLKKLTAAFQVGPTKTKIALVQFSGKASQKVEFGLDQYSDLEGIIDGIDRMEQLRSGASHESYRVGRGGGGGWWKGDIFVYGRAKSAKR